MIERNIVKQVQGDLDPEHIRAAFKEPPRKKSTRPSTSSYLWGLWRQGLKDLQVAVLGDIGGTHEEPATIANPVPMEVYNDRHPDEQTRTYPSIERER